MKLSQSSTECRYFLTYRGFSLPLQLVEPLEPSALHNRNTYVRAYFDAQERLVVCEKVVYGEVEVRHEYTYGTSGGLQRADIWVDDEQTTLTFPSED
jgi:Family of unknown function (DUF6156)